MTPVSFFRKPVQLCEGSAKRLQHASKTHIDAKKRIPNHNLHIRRSNLAHRIIPVRKELPNIRRPYTGREARAFVEQLEHIDHAANLLRHEAEGVDGAGDVGGVNGELGIGRALARVVVAVLGARRAVEVDDDVYLMGPRPVEGLQEVGPRAGDVRRYRRAKRGVGGSHWDRPIPDGNAEARQR